MDEGIKFFVGLDVHKDTIAVAIAETGRAPARLVGSLAHDVRAAQLACRERRARRGAVGTPWQVLGGAK